MRTLLFATIIAICTLAACSSRPGEVLGKEKMARVIADLNIAEVIADVEAGNYRTDSSKILLKQSVYAKNKVTPQQVDTSLKWYGYHMDKYLEVYDRAIAMIEEDIATTTERAGAMKETAVTSSNIYATEGDSVDLWRGLRLRVFADNMPGTFTTFNLHTDRNWQRGDNYTLNLRSNGSKADITMTIVADYRDGAREYITATTPSGGWRRLTLPLDSAREASQVYGFIQCTPENNGVVVTDSISLVRTRRQPDWRNRRTNVNSFQNEFNRY